MRVAHRFPWALGHPGQGDEDGRGVSNGRELIIKCSLTAPNQNSCPKRKSETRFDDLALRREFNANVVGFCRWLRQHGSSVSASEQMDALALWMR